MIDNITYDYFLAFQGGGKNGISYSGVFQTLRKFSDKIKIKSTIGTSVGSKFAL